MNNLSSQEKEALRTYKKSAGKRWKARLNKDWMNACSSYVDDDVYCILQGLRNRLGPSWLYGFKTSILDQKQCADCRDGEHDNYDDDVVLVFVRDPDTKKIVKRSYMCDNHVEMYLYDGFDVVDCKTKKSLGREDSKTPHKAYPFY